MSIAWPEAARRLKLRLRDPVDLTGPTLGRDVAEGLRAVFVLDDGGGAEVSVRADDVAGWHRSAEELWRAARENLAGEWDRAQRDVQSLDGGDVRIITGPSPFVSSLLLRLDDIGDLLPSGALVAVPHRQVLLATPLESESAAARVTPEMEALAEGLYAPGRAAISPGVFWWRFGAPLERASTVVAPRYTS